MEVQKSPRILRISRERVRQNYWQPMPWDRCRRTPFTETMTLGDCGVVEGKTNAKKCENIALPENPRQVRASRARVWQEHWEPMPWDYCRRTPFTETATITYDRSGEREKRKTTARLDKYRQYQVHYYGDTEEKEGRNAQMRSYLKKQLELVEPPQKQFVKRVWESEEAAERNRIAEMIEREKHRRHTRFLSEFKEDNKRVMDWRLENKKEQRAAEICADKRNLSLNPINWSHSLW